MTKENKKENKEQGHNRGKKYDKPVSLHPLSTEEALEALLNTEPPPKKNKEKREKRRG